MTIDLHKLDRIKDFDLAIAALEGFVEELTSELITTPEGKAYLKAYPQMRDYIGSWIDHLLYFGYTYESATLPSLTVSQVETILTQIFPNKISLLDPAEAETTIPELQAFWQWLAREYQHPHASAIVDFLTEIQPQYLQIMNDPQNFGIAKSFLASGMAAGFDMTSEAGISQFQEQHNQSANSEDPDLDIDSLIGDLTVMGSSLLSQTEQAELENTLQELASEVLSAFPSEIPSAREFQQQLQGERIKKLAPKTPELPQKAIALPKIEQKQGIFIFKVSWHQIWRRIAISSDLTLWDLSQLILRSVDFDSDHLDMFSYKNPVGKTVRIVHPYMDESPCTEEVEIGALPLQVGSVMEYLFDFGDNWEFQLELEEIRSDARPDYGEIIASHGEAPPQYPDWDEDWQAI